jgi:hypothetical protein
LNTLKLVWIYGYQWSHHISNSILCMLIKLTYAVR